MSKFKFYIMMVTVTFDFDSAYSDHVQEAHHRYEYTNNTNSDNEGIRDCMVTWNKKDHVPIYL